AMPGTTCGPASTVPLRKTSAAPLENRRDAHVFRGKIALTPVPVYHSCTYKEYGNGVRLDHGCLVLSTSGRSAVRWSRPVEGSIKTVTSSREADGWYACSSCAEAPAQPFLRTGNQTGIEVGM